MPLALLFDEAKDVAGDGVHADNSGTGTESAYKWEAGYANFTPTKWTGALKSQFGFHLKGKATFRIDGANVGPEALEIGDGLQLTVPLSAVNVTDTLRLGTSDARYRLSLSPDGKTILVAPNTGLSLRVR